MNKTVMRKLFYLGLLMLGMTSCDKDEVVVDPTPLTFELESLTARETTSGKTDAELYMTINGIVIDSAEVINAEFTTITFAYSGVTLPGFPTDNGFVVIYINPVSQTEVSDGGLQLLDGNGAIHAETTFEGSLVSANVTEEDEFGPTAGVISIVGQSNDDVELNIAVAVQ